MVFFIHVTTFQQKIHLLYAVETFPRAVGQLPCLGSYRPIGCAVYYGLSPCCALANGAQGYYGRQVPALTRLPSFDSTIAYRCQSRRLNL